MAKKFCVFMTACAILLIFGISVSAAPPSSDYVLVFEDEFDGTELNRDVWDYRTGDPYGGKNLKENVRIEDGMLKLDYKKVDGWYTGGGIITTSTMPYGYYEVEALVYSGAKGLHTSFWTSGSDAFETKPENHPENNWFLEIDVFEVNSREDDEIPNLDHGINNWCGEHTVPFSANYYGIDTTADWFVIGMEWLPDEVNYYINGELFDSFDGLNIYGPSYTWLTAVASPEKYSNGDGTYSIDDSKMDENGYFGSSLFKYFRYYQKPLESINLLGNPNFEYNRATDSSYPSTFVLHGDKSASFIQKTPIAYDGFYYHTHQSNIPYSLSTGQEFAFLAPGQYTFKGKFRATDRLTKAKLVAYDKDGNVLKEKSIPTSDNWTEVSLTDIQVDGYAYVAVESASEGGTMLSMDSLEFYIQDGSDYSILNTPYYEYLPEKDPLANFLYGLKDATSSTGAWKESGSDKGTYWLSGNLQGVEVTWDIPVINDNIYRLEVQNIINKNNVNAQDYYITLPDGTNETVSIDTKNGKSGWCTLGNYDLNAGDSIKVTMKPASNSGTARVTNLRFMAESEISSYEVTVLRLDEPVFCHLGSAYIFDQGNYDLTPYEKNGTVYIPYQALKGLIGESQDIDPNSEYITTTQLENSGFGVTFNQENIFLHDNSKTLSEETQCAALDMLYSYTKPLMYKIPTYIGTQSAENEAIHAYSDALYHGTTWHESKSVRKHKYSNQQSHFAQWNLNIQNSGRYALEMFCPCFANAETDAYVTVTTADDKNNYILNQTGTSGWYSIGILDLSAEEMIKVKIEKKDNSGYLRVSDLRLVPLTAPEITVENPIVNIDLGHSYYYTGSILLKEQSGRDTNYQILTPDTVETKIQLTYPSSQFELFFWKDLKTLTPITSSVKHNQ